MFEYVSDVSQRETRAIARVDLYVPRCDLKVARGNIRIRGGKVWNYVPGDNRSVPTLRGFKNGVKNDHVFDHDTMPDFIG